MADGKILVIDDETHLRNLIKRLLELEGFAVIGAGSFLEGTSLINSDDFDIIISDVRLPDGNGLDFLPLIKQNSPAAEIIILTAYGKIEDGVKAIKGGAFDYIVKGDEDNKLVPVVNNAYDKIKLKKRIINLERSYHPKVSFENITGTSKEIREAIEIAKKAAASSSPILLYGETGTGKEIFARSIHNESLRRAEPFVAVNCSSFARELLESEMFGYKAGAFTGAVKNKKGLFEEADKGTLFLDEIGDMDLSLQAKLLRVLEDNTFIKQGDTKETKVDVRVIAATNADLAKYIREGKFRQDLYYRISVIMLSLPPLRQRKEDIVLLAKDFIAQYSFSLKKNKPEADDSFFQTLASYSFPGNTRELKNIIERIILLNDKPVLTGKDLPAELAAGSILQAEESRSMDSLEKKYIIEVLASVNNNKQEAARILGIGLTTLYRKLKEYNL